MAEIDLLPIDRIEQVGYTAGYAKKIVTLLRCAKSRFGALHESHGHLVPKNGYGHKKVMLWYTNEGQIDAERGHWIGYITVIVKNSPDKIEASSHCMKNTARCFCIV